MVSVYDAISIPIAGVSLCACLLLFLILKQLPINGFLVLICGLNISMTVRSISYFLKLIPNHGEGYYLLIDQISDLAGGLWTNLISITLLRMVYTLRTVNTRKELCFIYIPFIFSLCISLALYEYIDYGVSDDALILPYRIVYYLRVGVIVVNVLTYSLCVYFAFTLNNRVVTKELSSIQAAAIQVIVFRMQAYPLAQVIMRAGPIWHGYSSETMDSTAANYTDAITSPTCGLGYCLVFLYVQPWARYRFYEKIEQFWNYITCFCCPLACGPESRTKSKDSPSSASSTREGVSSPRVTFSHHLTTDELLEIVENDNDGEGGYEQGESKGQRYSMQDKEKPLSERERSTCIKNPRVTEIELP